MQYKYTVLTFIFNDYDILREPKKVDPNAEYICITDTERDSKIWNVVTDTTLVGQHPIYASYYVRYHPFKYVHADTVIVMDASIQINDNLDSVIDEFNESGADLSVMLSNFVTDEAKIDYWLNIRQGITSAEADKLHSFITTMKQQNIKGSPVITCALYRRSTLVTAFLNTVWNYLIDYGIDGVPNRLDEVVLHKALMRHGTELSIFPVSPQLIQSTYMTYCEHNSDIPVKPYLNFDQF